MNNDVNKALALAHEFGGTDGAHHKDWLIDKMVRALAGHGYERWVEVYEEGGKYEWPKGIAP